MRDAVLKGRVQFLLLAALFAAPLIAAWVLYFVRPDWQPQGRTNYGALVQPVQALPESLAWVDAEGTAQGYALVRGRWSLVMPVGDSCDEICATRVHDYRQMRLLLNEKRLRVQRLLLATAPEALPELKAQLAADNPQMHLLAPSSPDDVAASHFSGQPAGSVFVVDPLGNVMMVFPPDPDLKKVLRDIKRLLRLSQVG
ncbi:hypothetical protein JN531_002400 [Flagellatimonas centrodinii]|uniref:SCO family protein n=1 Tax=Flagellatimonas centrodinii TaxID=2806210 RepID=UPI001FF0646D|nr:hypothetical protein [Flagellatimonas centrodinii]ULQ47145.1 hypothetical protein JN531_002400 [Flagellatimonas centrodinii]